MSIRQEPGYDGQLVSLGGFKSSSKDRGRQVESRQDTLNNSEVNVLPANSRRIAAMIYISTATAPVGISLGELTTSADYTVFLNAGDTFQIDYQLPWTGVVIAATTGVALIFTTEISVP